MNSAMMIAVADVIEFNNRFNLGTFASDENDDIEGEITADHVLHNCGTTACVAGWVNALANRRPDDIVAAAADLDLTPNQAYELFIPTPTRPNVWQMEDPYEATAVEAAKCLREIAAGDRTFECDKKAIDQ